MRYASITSKPRDAKKVSSSDPDAVWCVTPKYHGTNFSISVDIEGNVTMNRRNGVLKEDDNFYGAQALVRDAEWMPELIRQAARNREQVRVFGELYGGHYPHPDVAPVAGAKRVQREVHYCPDVRFVAFDVYVGREVETDEGDEEEKDAGHYLDFNDARWICRRIGIPFVPVLHKGSFQDVYDWAWEHKEDPAIVDPALPPLENNTGEGFVLRPVQRIRGRSGRFKVKSKAFQERHSGPIKKKMSETVLNDKETEFLARICDTRFVSVASKELPDDICSRNIRKYGQMLLEDAQKDFDMEGVGAKVLKTALGKACGIVNAYIRSR